MPGERFLPSTVAKAYRDEFPGKFDDISDTALLKALAVEDPETYALVDVSLLGEELLPRGGTPTPPPTLRTGKPYDPGKGAYPLPTPVLAPSLGETAVSTGLRIVPAVAGAAVGSLAGPGGTYGGGAGGAMGGELAAQAFEKRMGTREEFSPGSMLFEGVLGAVNPAAKGVTLARRVATQAGYGAALGGVGTTGRSLIEQGALPTLEEAALGTALGATFGAATQAGVDGLTALYRGRPRPSTDPTIDTALQAKSYLEEIAAAQIPPEVVGGIRANMEATGETLRTHGYRPDQQPDYILDALGIGPPPPLALPPGRGAGPDAIRVYPEGVNPEIELVGSGAASPGRIVGGRDVGGAAGLPPPTLEQAIEGSLQAPPGPPRLVAPLVLSSQEGSTIPRGMDGPAVQGQLVPPPRPDFSRSIRSPQFAELGGAPPSPDQPRLPDITTPRPIDRTYATGPNAGPRREGETHGRPRPHRRQVQTGDKVSYETAPSKLRAEDPATYPPEVRRELATMAWELEQFPHERVQGGLSRKQLDMLTEEMGSVSEAVAEARRRGATAGGAIAGAPVYHDVIAAAEGSFPHVTRGKMLAQIRAALLEGRGSGLTDAAAQVARRRLAERAGVRGGRFSPRTRIRAQQGDEGDALIGWTDAEGNRTLPSQDLDPVQQTVREAETGELLQAHRFWQEGQVAEGTEPYFEAAGAELVRRGVIEPEQLDLTMEGPGGSKGPSILQYDAPGEPRSSPRTPQGHKRYRQLLELREEVGSITPFEAEQLAEYRRRAPGRPPAGRTPVEGGPPPMPEAQPALPGAEAVRDQEIPTPEVAEVPFSLTSPPPPKPRITPRTGDLFTDLLREEGVLIFDVPAGDRKGLKKWLAAQEATEGGETWFNRAEQAVEEGDWDKAFTTAAAASARSYMKGYLAAKTPQAKAAIERAVRGTPLQGDLNTGIIASARQRAGVGTAPPAKDFPPSPRVTQAGAARGKATLGPAGVLNPGARQRPLSSIAPATRAATLDREVVRLVIEGVDHPEALSTVPGNTDTYLRLFRQVGEQIYKGENLRLLREAGVKIAPEELAQHFNATISDAGRTLNLLSQFAQAHEATLTEAANRMSMGAALRGMVDGPPSYTGARGRVASPAGQAATQRAIDEVAERTSSYQAAALANDLQKRTAVGPLRALHDASYSFMLSKWNTAVRNYASFTGRYGVDSLDHALTIPLAHLTGDTPTAALSAALLKERGFTPFRAGTAVTPKQAWADDLQGIYNFTAEGLGSLAPTDARRSIRMLLDLPDQAAHFLGSATGEDLSAAYANVPVMRYLTNPKVQRVLTMFNRAQEFSARATVFDATTRALLRAKGLDPTDLLQRPTSEIIQAVGGQRAFEDLLFTATAQSLEATFAGRTSKDSLPGALIRFINDAWPLKLGVPFPRFNFSAAPRWLYDHSPAALLDLVRFPLDRAGLTAPKGTVAGGRLYRGVRAQEILRDDLPALQGQIGQAERQQGEALQELLSTQREWQVRQRQVARLERRYAGQTPLGEGSPLAAAREVRDQLGRRRTQLKATIHEATTTVKDLKAEQTQLLNRVSDATGINAPNYAQFLARMGVGTVGMLGAAWVVRAQEAAQGTRWYEYRVDRGEGKDPIILDFRPFAPFAQYLFVADVLQDFSAHTDWAAAKAQAGEEGYGPGGALAWSRAVWENYEGKYTEAELGAQFAQAFLSISRAAGTTLTLTDLMTQNGWPSLEDAARATIGTVGQFLSRFTVPGQQVSDVVGQFDPEEAKVRTPPKTTADELMRPIAGPLANVPYARQLIPETLSQTTGRPVAAEYPLLRGLLGIGTSPRDFVVEEVRRVGVPGQSVYIRETGDVGIDRLVAETYARLLKQELPTILEAPEYQALGTPARQRDYLQRFVFPALKRATLAEVRGSVGEAPFQEATVTGENARRQARQARMLADLEAGEPPLPAEETPAPGPTPPPPPPTAF